MSDNIPLEIQAEIIKHLPIKTLIQFRSVSKPWKSLIDSSKFICDYHSHHTQPQNYVLIRYIDPKDSEQKYISILDDENGVPENMFPLTVPISIKVLLNMPMTPDNDTNSSTRKFVNVFNKPTIVGSSQGLFCLYDFSVTNTVVLWNPSIRKSVDINVANVLDLPYETVVGFGVCPLTSDPKLVKVTQIISSLEYDTISCIPWQVEVFSLSSGIWRSPYGNLPSKSVALTVSSDQGQVDIDGVIYWLASDREVVGNEFSSCLIIMSFNLTSEEFTEVDLPDSLAEEPDVDLFISKLRDYLVVLEYNVEDMKRAYGVWMMVDHGAEKSFTKLYTIKTRQLERVLAFRKSGLPIVGKRIDPKEHDALHVLDINSKRFKSIGISGKRFSFFASSYVETLLLLDH